MKGVGAEHQVLMSATSICECEHSHLYVSLISARQGRATPFKREKDSKSWSRKKAKPEKGTPSIPLKGGGLAGPDSFYHEFEYYYE